MGFRPPRAARLLLLALALPCLCDASGQCRGVRTPEVTPPEVTPPRLLVKYGDRASANCTALFTKDTEVFAWEFSHGRSSGDEWMKTWEVDSVTEWNMRPQCYITYSEGQCSTFLDITVYQLPVNVSFIIASSGQPVQAMVGGGLYELQCEVQDVAPAQNLTVTFYRGQTVLHTQRASSTSKTPGPKTEIFRWNMTVRAEDDRAEFWCDARLDLGPEGPPAVNSELFTVPVFFPPHIAKHSDQTITITKTQGETLELNCSATGSPAPSYSWTHPEHGPANGSAIFTIDHVTTSDQGNYTCVASNTHGRDSITYRIDVNIDLLPIIAGVVAALIVAAMVAACFVYCFHYKQTRMGRYNLMRRIFPSHHGTSSHVATPNGLSQSSV